MPNCQPTQVFVTYYDFYTTEYATKPNFATFMITQLEAAGFNTRASTLPMLSPPPGCPGYITDGAVNGPGNLIIY